MTLTPEQVATEMQMLGFVRHTRELSGEKGWIRRGPSGPFIENTAAAFLCQTIQDRVEEARKGYVLEAKVQPKAELQKELFYIAWKWFADNRFYSNWRTLDEQDQWTAKDFQLITPENSAGSLSMGVSYLVNTLLKAKVGLTHKLYTQQEVDAKIREGRIDELKRLMRYSEQHITKQMVVAVHDNIEKGSTMAMVPVVHINDRLDQLKNGETDHE